MIEITHEPLIPQEITSRVEKNSNGAVVTFLGATRDSTGGRKVLYLEYEAYRPMADTQLAVVADEMRERFGVEDIAISHRLGRLELGDISLVVAVASPHRERTIRPPVESRVAPRNVTTAPLEFLSTRSTRTTGSGFAKATRWRSYHPSVVVVDFHDSLSSICQRQQNECVRTSPPTPSPA